MLIPRVTFASRPFVALPFFVCLLISTSNALVRAQQPSSINSEETVRGMELYRQGNMSEAINILSKVVKENEDDADAWYYLGLAYRRHGSTCAAIPAFEKVKILRPDSVESYTNLAAVLVDRGNPGRTKALAQRAIELGDTSAEMHFVVGESSLEEGRFAQALEEAEASLKIESEFAKALLLKSFAQLGLKQYQASAESLKGFLSLSPDDADVATWRTQIETLRAMAQSADNPDADEKAYAPKEVSVKARLMSRTEPQYTEEARKACVQGTVVLRGVLAADGNVKNLLVIKALGYGLTTASVKAARSIKFSPASVDSRLVSQSMQIEYNFNLY
jgi:TonB family protein